MKDADFKALEHPVGRLVISSRGSETSSGYKADLTITDLSGNLLYIFECEQKTDRKAFLGDLLKASRHAHETGTCPTLIVVMQTFTNTTSSQIFKQLVSYADWLSQNLNNGLSLSGIHVMTDEQYKFVVDAKIEIGSFEFGQIGSFHRFPPNKSCKPDSLDDSA